MIKHCGFCSFILVLFALCTSRCIADIELPMIISNGMVLQQDSQVPIWGWAGQFETVTVNGSWQKPGVSISTKAGENGKWMVKLNTPKAGGPYTVTIEGKNKIVLKDVLIGEVWVCSGQSNMWFPMAFLDNAQAEIKKVNCPDIRFFYVPVVSSPKPQEDCQVKWSVCNLPYYHPLVPRPNPRDNQQAVWLACNPENIEFFSSVAYFFGSKLHDELGVPIGLIGTYLGAASAEAWVRDDVLAEDKEFAAILEREREHQKAFEQQEASRKGKSEPIKSTDLLKYNQFTPGGLYNGMLKPIMPFDIKGVIWYQGETNAERAYQYRKLFPVMINNWRTDWKQGDFPFYFVQLANYVRHAPSEQIVPEKGVPGEDMWAELREAQLMTLRLPHTGMAVTIDIGTANDIHPKNKQDVGKRLALWALAKDYGKDIVYSGPIYKKMEIEAGGIRLYFDYVGKGLVAKNGRLDGFAIAGADKKFVWADAEIQGDTILVSSREVPNPVAVRYGWAMFPFCNLYNKEGLPASPFRTDDWPGLTVNAK
jgi:sialate O-acetylesterase